MLMLYYYWILMCSQCNDWSRTVVWHCILTNTKVQNCVLCAQLQKKISRCYWYATSEHTVEVFCQMYIVALCVDAAITHFRQSWCNISFCTSLQLPAAGHAVWQWPTINTLLDSVASPQHCAGLLSDMLRLLWATVKPSANAPTVILLFICLTSYPDSVTFYSSSEWPCEAQVFLLDPSVEDVIAWQVSSSENQHRYKCVSPERRIRTIMIHNRENVSIHTLQKWGK